MEISILPFHTRNQTSFKGAELNKRAAQELETVVKPFLAQYKHPQYDSLMRQLAAKLQQFADSNVYIQPNYNTKQFKEVSRLKLGELDTNLEEFEYLTRSGTDNQKIRTFWGSRFFVRRVWVLPKAENGYQKRTCQYDI